MKGWKGCVSRTQTVPVSIVLGRMSLGNDPAHLAESWTSLTQLSMVTMSPNP